MKNIQACMYFPTASSTQVSGVRLNVNNPRNIYFLQLIVSMSVKSFVATAAVAALSTGAAEPARCTGLCQESHEKYGSPRMVQT
jgi:hypothetical protein